MANHESNLRYDAKPLQTRKEVEGPGRKGNRRTREAFSWSGHEGRQILQALQNAEL